MIRTFAQNGNLYLLVQQFDHISEDEKTLTTFRVTEMLLAMQEGKLSFERVISPLDEQFARQWLPKRGLNLSYAQRLSKAQLNEPVLGVQMPDESILLIDGTHRYAAAFIRHIKEVKWLIVNYPDWLPFATIKENKP